MKAMPAPEHLGLVRVAKGGAGVLGRSGVGKHRDERRLVCNEGRYVVGIGHHEREGGHRAAAAREHLDGPAPSASMIACTLPGLDRGRVVGRR